MLFYVYSQTAFPSTPRFEIESTLEFETDELLGFTNPTQITAINYQL
ncbi:hypothetical protein CKA32_005352 [Geitlerinema sp. FC II]|nr:hypothetical protein CKA32_005352 [Geitlerinema sp. FC II]